MNSTKGVENNGASFLDLNPDDHLVKVLSLLQQLERFERLIDIGINYCCSQQADLDQMEDFRTLIASYCQGFPPAFNQLQELVESDPDKKRYLNYSNELQMIREYTKLAEIGLRHFPPKPNRADFDDFYLLAIAHNRLVSDFLTDFKEQVTADLEASKQLISVA